MSLTDSPVVSDSGAGTGTTTQSFTTTHSFSPSTNSMVLVRVDYLFANSSVTSTITLKDSHGTSYAAAVEAENAFDVAGSAMFWLIYTSAPGTTTLTASSSASSTVTGGIEFLVSPTLITGQASSPIGPNTINFAIGTSVTAMSAALVTTQVGSRVYLAGGVGSGSTMTAVSGTTTTATYNGFNNAATGISTAATVTPGSATYGWSVSPASAFGGSIIGVEVLPAATAATSTGTAGGGTRGAAGSASLPVPLSSTGHAVHGTSGAMGSATTTVPPVAFTARAPGGKLTATGRMTIPPTMHATLPGGRLAARGTLTVANLGPGLIVWGSARLRALGALSAAVSVGSPPSGPSGPGGVGTIGGANPGFDEVTSPDWFLPGGDLDPRVELLIGDAWTDISSRVFDENISLERGHPDESTTAAASTFSGTLDNSDGHLSSLNPLSPHFGLLGLNTPLRVSVPDTSPHLELEGDQTGYANCSPIGKLDSFELWFDADADNWFTDQVLMSQWNADINGRAFYLNTLPSGQLELGISTTGANANYVLSFPLPVAHGRISIRITYDATSGQVVFYTGQYCGDWVATALNTLPVGGPAETTASIEVGYATNAIDRGYPGFLGKVYAVAVLDSIGGTIADNAVAVGDFTTQTVTETAWTDAKSNSWTLHNSAVLSDRFYRFYGESAAWPQTWTPGDANARIAISAGGLLRRLGSSNTNVQSAMTRAYTRLNNAGLKGYWGFEDDSTATQLASGIGGNPFRWYGAIPQVSGFSGFTCSAPIVSLNKAALVTTIPRYAVNPDPGEGSDAILRFLLNVPDGGDANGAVIARISFDGGAASYAELVYASNGQLTLNAYDQSGALAFGFGPLNMGPVNGGLVRVSVELVNTGSNTYSFGLVVLEAGATSGLGFSVTHTGRIGSIAKIVFNENLLLQSTAIGHVSVETTWTSLFDLAPALNAYQGEVAGVRFPRLCAEESIPFRGIGNLTDTVAMGAQTIETLSQLLQECVDADQGVWLELRQALGWGFRTRNSLGNQTSIVSFDYDQDQLSGSLEPTVDDQVVKNDITVSNLSGSSSRQTLDDGSVRSIGKIGRYDTTFTVNLANDSMLDSQATWYLHTLTVNEPRFTGIEADLANAALGDLYWTVLRSEMGDRLTVRNPPVWLAPGLIDQLGQGATETIGRKAFDVQWNGIPSTPWNVAYADDVVFGRADTDGSVLNAAVNATAVTLSVATSTTGSPLWTTSSPDFPFDVSIGGERITVHGITGTSSPQAFAVTRSVNGVVKSQAANADVRLWTPSIISL